MRATSPLGSLIWVTGHSRSYSRVGVPKSAGKSRKGKSSGSAPAIVTTSRHWGTRMDVPADNRALFAACLGHVYYDFAALAPFGRKGVVMGVRKSADTRQGDAGALLESLGTPEVSADPYPVYARLRALGPVHQAATG